jgi:hypothetical protein
VRTTEDHVASEAARGNGGTGDTGATVEGADPLRPHANIETRYIRILKLTLGFTKY